MTGELTKIIEEIRGSNSAHIIAERKLQQMHQSLNSNIPKGIVDFLSLKKGMVIQYIFVPSVSEEVILIRVKKVKVK